MTTLLKYPRATMAIALGAAFGLAGCGGIPPRAAAPAVSAQQACAALKGKAVGGATVTAAAMVDATADTAAHCKVSATLAPTFEMVLQVPDNWNGKLYYVGGGGYNGSIFGFRWSGAGVLADGYAIAESNGGHVGGNRDASFASDPYLAYLFGSGSVPMAAAAAKKMLREAFGKDPDKSYFEGCSNGGREGLMAVQRNPDLFDAVIIRAPAYNWTGFSGAFNRNSKALAAPGAAFTAAKVSLLAKAVRDACDANDGIVDGLVSNPSACHFNPAVLRCEAGKDAGDTCLSDAQLGVVASWTTPASFADGAYTYPGWALTGNEDSPGAWNMWLTGATGDGSNSSQYTLQDGTVKHYLAKDPNAASVPYAWDSNRQALFGMEALNGATNPDIRPFMSRGGKLIFWHGTNDGALSNRATQAYYEQVKAAVGGQSTLDKFVRYYQAPGVNHCAGGPGPDFVNLATVLDKWVTQGTEPGQLTAAKLNADGSAAFTRPLCQYPQYPRYTGPANDANAAKLAANYTCTTP